MIAAAKAAARQEIENFSAALAELDRYETARSFGRHGLTSQVQPSNPKAFARPPVKVPTRPFAVLNAPLLAGTVGLTEGDRKFLTEALTDAAKRVNAPRVTPASLARQVFEGPEFADVLTGGPLPDRDEFKDRFVAGLDDVLKTGHSVTTGFAPDRREYASGPKYDPSAAAEREAAVIPTTACLRCHDVRASGKARMFEPIPALAFDPFDKRGREAWVRGTEPKRRAEVLGRMQQRLVADADMPPEDAPEYEFRAKDPAAFDEVKSFLATELEKARKR
jgi:hypothetical protein